jgi:cell division septum initiation protein DivIVA
MPKLTKIIIDAAIEGFEEQKRRIDAQIAELRAQLSGGASEPSVVPESSTRPRRKMSAAARKKIAEAQRKRWAAAKGESETPAKPKRVMSAQGRANIIAAIRKRYAAKKAAKK